ncbi:hypothetical protein [Streptomyces sp. NPDC047886]|uniref:hypothetical protein n=1 Tax=Streptomyces sp. NPDC047886 TaxID=3365490 RepID=UPI00371E39A6
MLAATEPEDFVYDRQHRPPGRLDHHPPPWVPLADTHPPAGHLPAARYASPVLRAAGPRTPYAVPVPAGGTGAKP